MRFLPPEWRERLSSTNTALLERLKRGEPLPSGFVLAAREQTAGRGRQGRPWVSHPGRDLTFSFLLRTPAGFPQISSLPMAVALGVAAALEGYGIRVQTKWPNDLEIEGRKICGILVERLGKALVIGIGLNVNMDASQAQAIDRPATSLRLETGQEEPIEKALDRLLQALPPWIERWEAGGFAPLRRAWIARCAHLGEEVKVREGKHSFTGVLAGFGDAGQLLLREADGTLRQLWTGEIDH